jgi:bifunctional NMN adenylyltransferase/nudix hydrolase
MTKMYDLAVVIGRFQGLTEAHKEMLRRAGEQANEVLVIIGSAYQPRTYKNPFTFNERHQMVAETLSELSDEGRFSSAWSIEPNRDSMYNDAAWAIRVQTIVANHSRPTSKICILGHKKDGSSFYLDMFPQWDLIDIGLIEPLNAADIRDLYFRQDANLRFIKGAVPQCVISFLERFSWTEEYRQIIREREFIINYKKQYASLPYPPIFVTVDAVVIQSGHVLMIKRRSEPGKGLWAIPGGFLNADTDRSVKDAMLRELREETGIKVPVPVLAGSIKSSHVFDAIERSTRGRTITHAFNIVLPDGPLPKVKGMDDAEKASWIPIGDINPEEVYEDHYDLIDWAVSLSGQ